MYYMHRYRYYVYTHMCVYIHICVYIFICTYICTCVHICIYTQYMCIHMISISLHIIHICVCVYIYMVLACKMSTISGSLNVLWHSLLWNWNCLVYMSCYYKAYHILHQKVKLSPSIISYAVVEILLVAYQISSLQLHFLNKRILIFVQSSNIFS